MDVLREVFERFGFTDIQTVIASGNVVFTTSTPPMVEDVEAHFEREVGFSSMVFVRSADEVRSILSHRPWRHDGAVVDVSFLRTRPDRARSIELEKSASSPEAIAVIGTEVFFLRAGRGLPTTHKEADTVRILGRESTRRGITTVERVAALLDP